MFYYLRRVAVVVQAFVQVVRWNAGRFDMAQVVVARKRHVAGLCECRAVVVVPGFLLVRLSNCFELFPLMKPDSV